MSYKKILIIIFIVFFIFGIYSCNKEPLKIGVVTALSGKAMPSGHALVESIRLFLQKNNLDNVELIPVDDEWDQNKIKDAYEFLKKKNVRFIVFGTTSSAFDVVYKELKDDDILGMVISSTSLKFKNKNDHVIRTIPNTEKEQKDIAEFLNSQNIKDLFVIIDLSNPVYTEKAYEYFKKYFNGNTVEVSVNFKSRGYTEEIKKYYKKYDNVYIIAGLIGEVGITIQQLKLLNQNVNIILVPWTRSKGLKISAGEYLKDVILPSHYPFEYSNGIKSFYEYFKRELNEEPALHAFLGYEIMQIFWETYTHGNNTPSKLESYISQNHFNTIFGKVSFDEYGESTKKMYFGKFDGETWEQIPF